MLGSFGRMRQQRSQAVAGRQPPAPFRGQLAAARERLPFPLPPKSRNSRLAQRMASVAPEARLRRRERYARQAENSGQFGGAGELI